MADEKITEEVLPAVTEEHLKAVAVDILKDAEIKLGRLGDLLHELRQQVADIRAKFERTAAP